MPDISAGRPVSGQSIETGWGQEVHDGLEGIQTGVANVTLSGSNPFTGSVAVTYPRAFAAYPVTVLVTPDQPGTAKVQAQATSINLTGFTIVGWRDGGSSGLVCPMRWVAIGKPA